ncbi:3-oxoacyl-ACP reductase FabG [Caballeronia sp. LZ035]|uniref:SDR family NAD(P)-dependent oxidoreductase n=1 Tax=Caballeronia sp. LZ035 TaxID=3038568 RepID=UPI0028612FCE|nr:3-oxoacyl-ACP reductase FabG [Caballeronia sp. LZ035]MDR5758951.1 3-oxoacyl-ACP reductase FabG [Caballeronia sp. LZ035]
MTCAVSGLLKDQVALITGAGRGMGRAHAQLLAAQGAQVIVHDVFEERVQETVALLEPLGVSTMAAVVDIADITAMTAMVKDAEARFGKIDILVNNAGISADRAGIAEIDESMYDRMFDIHVKGAFFVTRAVAPGMVARKHGSIINISSIWGQVGHHFGSTYCAAKAAMLGFTKAWAKEFAPHGVTVNAIAPGGVTSPMAIEKDGLAAVQERMKAVPMGRWAEPEEIAHAVLYFASPHSRFVTGQVINLSGGQTIVGI